jgi:uncharacterized cupin superfamily protein
MMLHGNALRAALFGKLASKATAPEGVEFSSAPRDLPLAPIEPADIEEGQPIARGITLGHSPDERLSMGLWDCTSGKFKWTFWVDEVVHILDGEATVREASGAVHELGPGSVAYFPLGLVARWEVPRYVRKLFVVRMGNVGPVARLRQRVRNVLGRGGSASTGLAGAGTR